MKIIAYGSLMNQASLERTLGRPAPLTFIRLSGYRRVFNAPFDGYAFLNLQTASGPGIEAASFDIKPAETVKFAVREAGSDLVEVLPGFYAFIWPAALVRGLPVLQSYLDFCQQAADGLGINLEKNLLKPRTIIDDSRTPLYP